MADQDQISRWAASLNAAYSRGAFDPHFGEDAAQQDATASRGPSPETVEQAEHLNAKYGNEESTSRPDDDTALNYSPVGSGVASPSSRNSLLGPAFNRGNSSASSNAVFSTPEEFEQVRDDAISSRRPFASTGPTAVNVKHWTPPTKKAAPYLAKIGAAEESHDMPQGLVASLIDAESSWDPKALSKANARGLTQIVPESHPGIDGYDTDVAIRYGASYLNKMKTKFGSWDLALIAYNWGPGHLDREGLENAPTGSLEYAKKILSRIHEDHSIVSAEIARRKKKK